MFPYFPITNTGSLDSIVESLIDSGKDKLRKDKAANYHFSLTTGSYDFNRDFDKAVESVTVAEPTGRQITFTNHSNNMSVTVNVPNLDLSKVKNITFSEEVKRDLADEVKFMMLQVEANKEAYKQAEIDKVLKEFEDNLDSFSKDFKDYNEMSSLKTLLTNIRTETVTCTPQAAYGVGEGGIKGSIKIDNYQPFVPQHYVAPSNYDSTDAIARTVERFLQLEKELKASKDLLKSKTEDQEKNMEKESYKTVKADYGDNSTESNDGIVSTLKSDAKLVAQRVAARKVVNVTRDLIVGMLSAGKTKKEAANIKTTIGSLLQTEEGKAVLSFAIGAMLPLIKMQLPEKYHSVAESMAQEFRVEGMVHFGTMLTDFITGPAFQSAKGLLTSAFDEALGESSDKKASTGVRVAVAGEQHHKRSEEVVQEESGTAAAHRHHGH